MRFALGLLGLALLGADGPSSLRYPIQYQVRVLEMNGLEWREAVYSRLRPVTKQGAVTVWTADRDVLAAVKTRAGKDLMAPQLLALPGAVAHFSQQSVRKVATQFTRHSESQGDHAVAVAYAPELEEVRDGCQFTLSGRKLDQGILAKVVVDETRITAIHQVQLSEPVCSTCKDDREGKLGFKVDVPEVNKVTLDGEWLIPNDGLLLVSFGANTVADSEGKAVVCERLMLIEADVAPAMAGQGKPPGQAISYVLPAPMPAPVIAMPALPSRTLPHPRLADGTLEPLPPLPEGPAPPSSMPGSSEPCASPQAPVPQEEKPLDPKASAAAPKTDPKTFATSALKALGHELETLKVGLAERKDLAKVETKDLPKVETKDLPKVRLDLKNLPAIDLNELSKIDASALMKPGVLRLVRPLWSYLVPLMLKTPVTAGITIEIRATVSASPKP